MNFSWCQRIGSDNLEEVSGETSPNHKQVIIEKLYKDYREELLRHIQGMVNDHGIAEELLHEAFIRLSRMPALSTIRQIRPFLYKIATNLALDYLRASKREAGKESDDQLVDWESGEPGQLEQVVRFRHLEQLNKAIDELPPRAREALILSRLQEKTLKEVARELNISQTMVEKHLRNALKKCRQLMKPELH